MTSFKALGLSESLVRALDNCDYDKPTLVQQKVIPEILAGHDVSVCAQTGTGKTAAFALPLIEKIAQKGSKWRKTTVLIISPTRELACQIYDAVQTYAMFVPVRASVLYGGTSRAEQVKTLKKGVQVLIATPGRLLDLVKKEQAVDLRSVEALVLDEADRLLEMGFVQDIRKIVRCIPSPSRQTLLFTATFSPLVRSLSREFLNRPKIIKVSREMTSVKSIKQTVYSVLKSERRKLLYHLMQEKKMEQVLIFVRTKRGAEHLAGILTKDGLPTQAIHSDKSQSDRQAALDAFKNKEISILVATDVVARGIDIQKLPYVVNYDLPRDPEQYVHRIGRTGRAGSVGEAISFYTESDMVVLRAIEIFIRMRFEREIVPGIKSPKS